MKYAYLYGYGESFFHNNLGIFQLQHADCYAICKK